MMLINRYNKLNTVKYCNTDLLGVNFIHSSAILYSSLTETIRLGLERERLDSLSLIKYK